MKIVISISKEKDMLGSVEENSLRETIWVMMLLNYLMRNIEVLDLRVVWKNLLVEILVVWLRMKLKMVCMVYLIINL